MDWRDRSAGPAPERIAGAVARNDGEGGGRAGPGAGKAPAVPRGTAGTVARAWLRAFGGPVNPATARVLARWAEYTGYDREDFIEAAVSAAALQNAGDPVGHVVALFRGWRARGIGEGDSHG